MSTHVLYSQVEGCDGQTTCGDRPSHGDKSRSTRWTWSYVLGKLTFSCHQVDSRTTTTHTAEAVCAFLELSLEC